VTGSPARARYGDAFAVAEFRALFAAYTASMLGQVVATVALTVLVYDRTSSPLLAALTFTLNMVPWLLGGVFLSALVDRRPPRQLMVMCDLSAACLIAVMAIPALPVRVLLALLVVVSLVTSISSSTRNALLPRVVGATAYVPARSLFRLVSQSSQVVGSALGGAALVVLSPLHALQVNAFGFLASAVLIRVATRPRLPLAGNAAHSALLRDSVAGVRAALADTSVRRLLAFGWLVATLAVAPEAVAAPYVASLGKPSSFVGWWLVALPAGTIVGQLLGIWGLTVVWQQKLVGPLAGLLFVPFLAFLVHPSFAPAFALLFCAGVANAYFLGLDGLVLKRTPRQIQSRVLGINSPILTAMQGLGFGAAGALASVFRPQVVIFGSAIFGLGVVLLLHPRQPEPQVAPCSVAAPIGQETRS
jgi:hypothetical protein